MLNFSLTQGIISKMVFKIFLYIVHFTFFVSLYPKRKKLINQI